VTRTQRDQRILPAKLETIAVVVQRTVPRCDGVSIGLVVHGDAGTAAVSSEIAIEADLAQYRAGEGPCLLSATLAHPVRIDVLDHDERFVHFAPLALDVGIASVLSIPLIQPGNVVGSLNLYSSDAEAFTDQTTADLETICSYAAQLIAGSPLYVYSVELLESLELTVRQRDTIQTAVGVLMEANTCNETTALTLLRRAADDEDRELVDVARLVIAAHTPTGTRSSEDA